MELLAFALFVFSFFLKKDTMDSANAITKNIFVSLNGNGDFKTIQEAIDSVPNMNNAWVRIHVEKGVYREKVTIPKFKDYILLEGQGSGQTSIEWGDHVNDGSNDTTASSATFSCYASNFMARDISFKNTFENSGPVTDQAVAALVAGDNSSFYRCSFYSIQDTLCDFMGRHYYQNCFIEGSLDFIFGQGQSIFETSTISIRNALQVPGFVTAHGRDNNDDMTGFVFKSCKITGSSQVYLGRAWRPFARVIFYDTFMPNIIVPLGWNAWQAKGSEGEPTFVESKCKGPGSNTSNRVTWMKTLSDNEIQDFTSLAYIDSDGWIEAQPR